MPASGQGRHPTLDANGDTLGVARTVVPAASVRAELERVLSSPAFRGSRRSQDFLRYVVETTLQGKGDQLKERTIGVDVFGRPAEYEPSDDATVRVKAGEVRKRLGLYYASEGQSNEVRIDLPGGGYVPEFRFASAKVPVAIREPVSTSVLAAEVATAPARRWNRIAIALSGVILLALVSMTILLVLRHPEPRTVVDQFWQPVLQQAASPVVLSAAYVPVYASNRAPSEGPPSRVGDFTLLTDQFIGGGDLLAISNLSSMLSRMHRAYQVKIGTELSFSDMRASPTVLVGYSYTHWRDISKEMRFFIDENRRPLMVLDNGQPTSWALQHLSPDKHTDEDYAIVSRVFHPDTRTLLVEIAGITQYGTMAAGELVTNADLLREALNNAPPGWPNKNLQFVLHAKVISGVAASPHVVASYFW